MRHAYGNADSNAYGDANADTNADGSRFSDTYADLHTIILAK
jgi:hypothetical protein